MVFSARGSSTSPQPVISHFQWQSHQMRSGFPRHPRVKFHLSVKSSSLECKIGQPFGEFTTSQPPESKKKGSRGDILTLTGIIVAAIGLLLSLTIPEVRQFIGLDRPAQASKSLRLHYPQLWQYYSGNQQVYDDKQAAQGKNATNITLDFLWQTPVEGTEGKFVGYINFAPVDQEKCNLGGLMSPLNPITSYADITFTCFFQHKMKEIFDGEIYPDSHISGIVTDPGDPSFSATWRFYAPQRISPLKPFGNGKAAQPVAPKPNGPTTSTAPGVISDQPAPICNAGNCPGFNLIPILP